jgi:hypothetical protein
MGVRLTPAVDGYRRPCGFGVVITMRAAGLTARKLALYGVLLRTGREPL